MERKQDITSFSLFFWVLTRCRSLQLLAVALILMTIFLRVLPLEMQKKIVNLAIGLKSISNLIVYCTIYITSVITAGLLKYAVNVITNFVGQKILYEIRTALFNHILRLPLTFFRKTPPGTVISFIIGELGSVGEFLGEAIATPFVNILSLVAFAGYMFYLNPLLALVSLCVYPFQVVVVPLLQNKFNRLNQERMNITKSASNFVGEVVSGIHEVHCNASYNMESEKFQVFVKLLFDLRYRMAKIKFLIKWANNFFQNLGPFILFLFGGYLSIKGRLDLGALVAFLSTYEKLSDPWKELTEYYQSYQDARVRYQKVMETFSYSHDFKHIPSDRPVYALSGDIEMANVSFIVDQSIRVLDSVSLKVKPNERIAIVGFSGSGKSTLIMLLAQLYDYSEGRILIDGKELRELTKADVSLNIGYVSQTPFVFSGTIRENLLYACNAVKNIRSMVDFEKEMIACKAPYPDYPDLMEVIEQVGLEEDVLMFGLNSKLQRNEQDLADLVLAMRKHFMEKADAEIMSCIEFFDEKGFMTYQSLGINLVGGFSLTGDPEEKLIMANPGILDILERLGLLVPLAMVGQTIVRATMDIFSQDIKDDFFARITPLSPEELPRYRYLGETRRSIRELEKEELSKLTELALRYVPALHTIISIPAPFTDYVVRCRSPFRESLDESLRQHFCFINPGKFCWRHSVFQNIIFGSIRAEIAHAEETVRTAVIKTIEDLGMKNLIVLKGLDYHVGTQGSLLSGGQKQKLCLARVLLKKPSILILDEITSGLDNKSQAKVQELIKNHLVGRCTVFSVIHRLETVKDYDRIIVMRAGKIVEAGTYEELIEKKGHFYDLLRGF
jgi:putative ABC transport system ATP-binding protein